MTIYVIRLHVLLNLTIEQSKNPTKKNKTKKHENP